MDLRPYQQKMINDINGAWAAGNRNVLAVLPTGTGKTVIFSRIARDNPGPVVAIAHRQELVGQISTALATEGVSHKIVGSESLIRFIVNQHLSAVGRSYYDPQATTAVVSVDTFIRRKRQFSQWLPKVTLWIQDEAHHIQRDNKWGEAAAMIPNARGLGVTATPLRADGGGLSRATDGLMDTIVVGPPMRSLIQQGYLSDYRIFAPAVSDLDLSGVAVSPRTGDYTKPKLVAAVRRSRIIGDVVDTYLREAVGKLGITFATDVDTAATMAADYRRAGVPAEVVSYKTADVARSAVLRRFRRREILQIVNVDLFGEGFDLPAVEVVSFARPTQSYGLYVQQFGRALRISEGKDRALILDFVGNVVRHGLPDAQRVWCLDRSKQRNGSSDPPTVKVCPECTYVYERYLPACPDCGFIPVPIARTSPEFVDGDITELDDATLARMRGEIDAIDIPIEQYHIDLIKKHCPPVGIHANVKRRLILQEAQGRLRNLIATWGAVRRLAGDPDSVSYRKFYLRYGVDVLTAQTLPTNDAVSLAEKIQGDLRNEYN